jgi:outer membrane protein assembly factor BamD (BamD/ComL family)
MSSAAITPAALPDSKSELTEEQRKKLLEEAIERQDKLAESELEMARMFIAHEKTETAQRRLRGLIANFGASAAAVEAAQLLADLNSGG